LWIRWSCFINLASRESAAIFLFSVTDSVAVELTLFLNCSAAMYGGACTFMGSSIVTLAQCCASLCSGDLGHFCYFSSGQTELLNETTISACADRVRPPLPRTGDYGAIRFGSGSANRSSRALNFTKCFAERASAIECGSGSTGANQSLFSFFTILNCTGADSVRLPSSVGIGNSPFNRFSFGNLYNNNCTSAVFTLASTSISIESCVFRGNTKDLTGTVSANSILIGCCFFTSFPTVSNLSVSGNFAETVTQSIAISISLPFSCPLSLCPTWSFMPSLSLDVTAILSQSRSPILSLFVPDSRILESHFTPRLFQSRSPILSLFIPDSLILESHFISNSLTFEGMSSKWSTVQAESSLCFFDSQSFAEQFWKSDLIDSGGTNAALVSGLVLAGLAVVVSLGIVLIRCRRRGRGSGDRRMEAFSDDGLPDTVIETEGGTLTVSLFANVDDLATQSLEHVRHQGEWNSMVDSTWT
jgi:hypothetical protein